MDKTKHLKQYLVHKAYAMHMITAITEEEAKAAWFCVSGPLWRFIEVEE